MQNFLILLLLLPLSACAFGQKTSYEGRSNFDIQTSDKNITVAVHDMRPYVQSGNKEPDFTGILKSLYGIPYDVSTKSGNPLADDFGLMIVNTMQFKNISAVQQKIPFSWSFATVKEKLLGKSEWSRFYYIKMFEWKTETHFRPSLHYNLQLLVFDEEGKEVENNEEKGFFYFDKKQPGKENLATSTSTILEELFLGKKTSLTPSLTESPADIESNATPTHDATEEPPGNIKKEIRQKCAADSPSDFVQQAKCVKLQEAGWMEINQ